MTISFTRLTTPLLLCAAALGAGCAAIQRVPDVDVIQPTTAKPAPAPVAAAPTGAIFQADRYRPLVEDHRARLVGDTLMVQIAEKITATQKATSSVDKSGEIDASLTALPGVKAARLARMGAAGSNSNTFAGKGVTESSNDFSGTITATVVQVLPNGHLVVSAEKQIGVNANVDVLRFSGQIDPRSIAPGNSVLSTQIANVRIEQRGRGQQAEAQSMGWLSRFFLTLMPI
ncbi:flagellar basal body L-ring protein FlgH [Aquabacterium sp.]|uniref:flagellar basal body L-ring protein FlgH n=1 Tax=Aquabacterium sp. TaxID=1872578 RepID=UPI002CF706A7|nr:flagellar basal body L-ring protein FlgH [Aquabacterium sp.]HSW07524.1 flagellar basal body L-ring protein FlgH [Aquabacterium sp.]